MDNMLSLRMSTNGFRAQERQGEYIHCISDPKELLCHALTGILNEYQFPEQRPLVHLLTLLCQVYGNFYVLLYSWGFLPWHMKSKTV